MKDTYSRVALYSPRLETASKQWGVRMDCGVAKLQLYRRVGEREGRNRAHPGGLHFASSSRQDRCVSDITGADAGRGRRRLMGGVLFHGVSL